MSKAPLVTLLVPVAVFPFIGTTVVGGRMKAKTSPFLGRGQSHVYRRCAIVSESDLREAVEKLGTVTAAAAP
jgi:hypothetical protein